MYSQVRCGDQIIHEHITNNLHLNRINPKYIDNYSTSREDTLCIDVVVHIVYNTEEQNLSDDLVYDQIEILNENFNRKNPSSEDTRDIFLSRAASANIKFNLVEVVRKETDVESWLDLGLDPLEFLLLIFECGLDIDCILGNLLDPNVILESIDRVKHESTGGSELWDTERYLNIYVCNMELVPGTPLFLGYAYPPVDAPLYDSLPLPLGYSENDGLVIQHQLFGSNNPNIGTLEASAGEGLTTVHEVGHYLGLRHIWGDGDCEMEDGLDDTPSAASPSTGDGMTVPTCEELFHKNSCNDNSPLDEPDMIENFMDYSPETCQNMFSKDQVNMMRFVLQELRSGLISCNETVSVYDNQLDKNLTLFPNPSNGKFQISTKENINSVEVYSLNYEKVKSITNIMSSNFDLDVNSGIYFLRILFDNDSRPLFKKIVVR